MCVKKKKNVNVARSNFRIRILAKKRLSNVKGFRMMELTDRDCPKMEVAGMECPMMELAGIIPNGISHDGTG